MPDQIDYAKNPTGQYLKNCDEDGMSDIESTPRMCHRTLTHTNINRAQIIDDDETAKMNFMTNDPVSKERTRRKVVNMVITNNALFILGNSLSILWAFYEQLSNLLFGAEYKKNYEDFGVINVIANLLLYASMSFSFFVYVYYLKRFRQFLVNTFSCIFCAVCCKIEQLKKKSGGRYKTFDDIGQIY